MRTICEINELTTCYRDRSVLSTNFKPASNFCARNHLFSKMSVAHGLYISLWRKVKCDRRSNKLLLFKQNIKMLFWSCASIFTNWAITPCYKYIYSRNYKYKEWKLLLKETELAKLLLRLKSTPVLNNEKSWLVFLVCL